MSTACTWVIQLRLRVLEGEDESESIPSPSFDVIQAGNEVISHPDVRRRVLRTLLSKGRPSIV